ncbi:restriction endonuclease [Sphingobacterium suaedae]|uniref:Restriction endonuclease n=1 Tax=Sphingobacterium suaedae TaxID=1686402 RepID=A0ABW5KIS5_9SPHI
MKKGKQYELLIERLYNQIASNAIVTQNDSIYGSDSGDYRQIDVSIRYKIADIDHLIAIEVKDYNHPAGINVVDGFASVIKDIGANKGVIVCSKGFSKMAQNKAKTLGIELLTVHSAENKNWTKIFDCIVRRQCHYYNLEFFVAMRAVKGEILQMNPDSYQFEDGGKIKFMDVARQLILDKVPWKEIIKGKKIRVPINENTGLYGIVNDQPRKIVSGYMNLQYLRTTNRQFAFPPDNYMLKVNHNSQLEQLHSLEVNVAKLIDVLNLDYEGAPISSDTFHYEIDVHVFNNTDLASTIKFNQDGAIFGIVDKDGNYIRLPEGEFDRKSIIKRVVKSNTAN